MTLTSTYTVDAIAKTSSLEYFKDLLPITQFSYANNEVSISARERITIQSIQFKTSVKTLTLWVWVLRSQIGADDRNKHNIPALSFSLEKQIHEHPPHMIHLDFSYTVTSPTSGSIIDASYEDSIFDIKARETSIIPFTCFAKYVQLLQEVGEYIE